MLKLFNPFQRFRHHFQPPSGGCVLKRDVKHPKGSKGNHQPPSGGCVLKQFLWQVDYQAMQFQPPSGGCVLKQNIGVNV